jgi:hypothetical protein
MAIRVLEEPDDFIRRALPRGHCRMRQRPSTRVRSDSTAGRGTAKVRCVLLLHALAHNLMRALALAPSLLGHGEGAPIGTAGTV